MATPPRANFYDVVLDLVTTSATYGKPISNNIQVTVYQAPPYAAAAQTTTASIFSGETGATSPGNPFSLPMAGGGAGELNFWAAPGSYDLKIVDSSSPKRFADKLVRWDAIPGDKGNLGNMLDDALAAQLGINQSNSSTVRRGSVIVPGDENYTATTYGYMPTPDRVQNVKLETSGIIWAAFVADYKLTNPVANNKVGLFLDGNLVVMKNAYSNSNALLNFEIGSLNFNSSQPSYYGSLGFSASGPGGAAWYGQLSSTGALGPNPAADSTNGQLPGSNNLSITWVPIVASAGTHEVSIRWQAVSGTTITARNRRLYVKAEAF